jgi:hypothetical protein
MGAFMGRVTVAAGFERCSGGRGVSDGPFPVLLVLSPPSAGVLSMRCCQRTVRLILTSPQDHPNGLIDLRPAGQGLLKLGDESFGPW